MGVGAAANRPARLAPMPGACGRCYEVRCREGMLLGWDDEPIQIADSYYFPRWVGMGEGICW